MPICSPGLLSPCSTWGGCWQCFLSLSFPSMGTCPCLTLTVSLETGGGSSAARLEAGGRQSQGAGALRVPSRTRSLCAFSGPPGGQCRPLPPRSGSRRAAGPAPRPHAAAPSPAPPLASHSECGQIPSAFPAPSPAFPRASGGLLITSAGSLSLIPAPTGAATCHRLYWSQPKTRGLFVYLLPKKLSCAFMSVRSWFVLFTVLV